MEVYLPEAGVQINIILILFVSFIVLVAGVAVSFIRRQVSKRINKQTT